MEFHAPRGMCLRVEEHFHVADVLARYLAEILHREVVEILRGEQHAHAFVIRVQERGEVIELVGGPHLLLTGVRQLHAIARGELEFEIGFQGTFNMQMQLNFGQALHEGRNRGHIFPFCAVTFAGTRYVTALQ